MLHDDRTARADATAPWTVVQLADEQTTGIRWLRRGELPAIPEPTMALQLDAILRHLEIDAEFGDWQTARAHLTEAQSTWRLLGPALARRIAGQPHLREASDAGLEMERALSRASDAVVEARAGDVVRWARRAIALADAIERVFE
jgi:hypothetical protein